MALAVWVLLGLALSLMQASLASAHLERGDLLRWGGCGLASPKLGPCQEVSTGAELREALANQTVRQVLLLQNVTVFRADFPVAVVVERELMIRGARPGVTLFVDDYYEQTDPGRNWVSFHSHVIMARLTLVEVFSMSSVYAHMGHRGMDFSGPGYDGSPESYCRCTSATMVEIHSLVRTLGPLEMRSARQVALDALKSNQVVASQPGKVAIIDTGYFLFEYTVVSHPGYLRRALDTYNVWPFQDDHGIDTSKLPTSTDCHTPELRGQDYLGNLSTTRSGLECIPWSQTGTLGASFGDPEHNYCRSFGGIPAPWCVVKRADSHSAQKFAAPHEIPVSGLALEFCAVPECPGPEDCWNQEDQGFSYRGRVNQTASGTPCNVWAEQFHDQLGYVPENFCRNPLATLGKERPWCFAGAKYNFEFCDIPVCEGSATAPPSNSSAPGPLRIDSGMVTEADESSRVPGTAQPSLVTIISAAITAGLVALGSVLAVFCWGRRGNPAAKAIESGLMTGSNISSVRSAMENEMLSQPPPDLGLVELKAVIGKGAFSQVWSGRWRMANAAIKIVNLRALTAETSARIRNGVEANTLQKLSHPNIVQTFHVYKVQDVNQPMHLGKLKVGEKYEETSSEGSSASQPIMAELWLIQELCEKGDLSVYRQTFQPMTGSAYEKLLLLLCEVALALQFLHDIDIVHGDLKGQNIIMKATDGRDTAKVADFGMAHRLEGLQSYNSCSQYAGDIRYLSPEMLESNEVSAAMDIYSFGALMYECYTGQDYRLAESLAGHVKSVLSGVRPELPPECPESYQELVRRCWSASPLDRPSANQLAERLDALLTGDAGGAGSPAKAQRVGHGGMLRVTSPTSKDSNGYLTPMLPSDTLQQQEGASTAMVPK